MIDTHAHIDANDFNDDRDTVIKRAFDSGVESIIIPAINPERFDSVVRLAEQYPQIYFGIGVHPHNANEWTDQVEKRVLEIAKHPKCKAIGEMGLDYYYDFAPKDVQKDVFRKQLKIAKMTNKPAIIHNRESDDDLLEIIKQEQDGTLKGVLHCFSSPNILEIALELGMKVSFTGNITFKKSILSDTVFACPNDSFMIETDSPYMAPMPMRGKRNEPSYVEKVADKIAEIKNLTKEEIINMTTNNAKKFFMLPVLFLMFAFSFNQVIAQDEEYDDEEYFEDSPVELTKSNQRFPKFIGISPIFGLNTVVETELNLKREISRDVSYDGIPAIGGSVIFSPFPALWIEAGYIYSKNTGVVQQAIDQGNPDRLPNIHQMFEVATKWVPNPNSTVNFFGTLGGAFFQNQYDRDKSSSVGLTFGVGFNANMSLGNAGLLCFMAEWRINTPFLKSQADMPVLEIKNNGERVFNLEPFELSNFFSIPRASLVYYPNFWN